jgi:hypothetical protein
MVSNSERKNRLLLTIEDTENEAYINYLSNPLLLSMFILAFESHPEIPDKKSAFYKNVFDTLYSKHDGITKNSFPREKLTKLQRDDFENILGLFSYLSLLDKKINFTEDYFNATIITVKKYYKLSFETHDLIYDLLTSISIFIKEGFELKFPHRSMQEYFAATFISKLPTDKKGKAYEKLIQVIEKSYDRSMNLEEICLEIDYIPFVNYVVLPQLKTIYSSLNFENDKGLIISYIKTIDARLLRIKKADKDFMIVKHSNYKNSMLNYFKIYKHGFTIDFMNNPKLKDELNTYCEKRQINKSNLVFINREMIDILFRYNYIEEVKRFTNALKSKIGLLEDNLRQQEENINDLLF